jgi:ATP-binding cassette subfamily B protein
MRNIYVEVDNLIDNFILPTIEVTYTVLVLVFVSFFLFFYDPETTIIIFLLIVPIFFVFYSLTKARLLFYGSERALLHQKILKKIPNALNGFFEIKLFGISEIVNKDLMKSVRRLNKIKIPQAIIGNIPRSFLEIFVISCFSIFLIYQIDNGEDILPLIAKLSIYVIVIIKLLPFLNGIATFYSKLMRGIESYKILVIEFSKYVNIPKSDKKAFTQDIQNITFDKVSYKYINETNNKNNIFENINLEIKKNDFVGIVGASGSGKTTFLKLITGMLKASEGKIFVNKDDIRKIDQRFFYQKISYIPQDPFFIYDDIVKNIISSNMLKEIDEDKIIKILEKVQLSQFIKNNKLANSFIGENANYLSGGEKQRLAIARAFYKESSLLIFDEITNKLDKKTSDKIMSLINSLKGDKTIIIVSHNVNNLTNTNYNLSLENNKILKIK